MIRYYVVAIMVAFSSPAFADKINNVVSIGGSVTEIVYALGQGDLLVARDSTSSFPPETSELPDVGYMRALTPEGVLSVAPELIISEDGAGPVETIEVLQQAEIPFIIVPDEFSGEGIVKKILAVGKALEVEEEALALADRVAGKLAAAETLAAEVAGEDKARNTLRKRRVRQEPKQDGNQPAHYPSSL